jgi:hypothetical protein
LIGLLLNHDQPFSKRDLLDAAWCLKILSLALDALLGLSEGDRAGHSKH